MRTNNVEELGLEQLETVNGGFWSEVGDFCGRLLDKCRDVLYRLKDWG